MIEALPVTALIDGEVIDWNKEPPSVDVARYDLLRLTQDVKDVETQLAVASLDSSRNDPCWRKKAMWAARSKERRAAFLADWLRVHDPWGTLASVVGPMVAHRLGALEAVLIAAERAVAEDTDDAYDELADQVARARAAVPARVT